MIKIMTFSLNDFVSIPDLFCPFNHRSIYPSFSCKVNYIVCYPDNVSKQVCGNIFKSLA